MRFAWFAPWMAVLAAAACTPARPPATGPGYAGELEIFLVPYDAQRTCAVTVGLRNVSGVRQREAYLEVAWYGDGGDPLAVHRLRIDPLLEGRYAVKNETLPELCGNVRRGEVRSAEWVLFMPGDAPLPDRYVTIDGVHRSSWRFRWDPALPAYVGEATAGSPGA